MSEHTKEPWPPYGDVAQQMHPILDHTCAWLDFDDYNRARVCVNACEGLSTEQLKTGQAVFMADFTKIHYQLHNAKTQRDELLEALKELACLGNGDKYGNSIGNVIAQRAIAKCEQK